MGKTPNAALSLRAFAKRLTVSHTAVEKGVASGRLEQSVGRDARGRPVIVDEPLARQEWAQGASKPRPRRAQGGRRAADPSLVEATRRVAVERARKLQLENDQKAGRLLPVDEVRRVWSAHIAAVRTKLLALPVTLADKVHRTATLEGAGGVERALNVAVRDVLTELATGDDERPQRATKRRRTATSR